MSISRILVHGTAGTTTVLCAPPVRTSHFNDLQGLALFFPGDQVPPEHVPQSATQPWQQLQLIRDKFPACAAMVVMPTLVRQGIVWYDNLVPQHVSNTRPLDSIQYAGESFLASSHLSDVVARVLALGSAPPPQQLPPCQLVGFSKGGTVLNQVLAEMAVAEMAAADGGPASGAATHDAADQDGASSAAAAAAAPGCAAASLQLGSAQQVAHVHLFLDSISHIHFLDAGLNCRGAYLTDQALISSLGMRHQRGPLAVHLHGTPRQWEDQGRWWIAQEKDLLKALLQEAGVPVFEAWYFKGQPPSLRMHFDIIQAMQVDNA